MLLRPGYANVLLEAPFDRQLLRHDLAAEFWPVRERIRRRSVIPRSTTPLSRPVNDLHTRLSTTLRKGIGFRTPNEIFRPTSTDHGKAADVVFGHAIH